MTSREPDGRREEGRPGGDPRGDKGEGRAAPPAQEPDVLLDVPKLDVEELNLEVRELEAHIAARAELAGFLSIDVGVGAYLDDVKLEVKGVEAQVQLKVELERILGTIERALQTIDDNPQLLDAPSRGGGGGRRRGRQRELPAATTDTGRGGGPAPDQDPARQAGGDPEISATRAARTRAEELGVELSAVEGSGADGRVLVRDVVSAANER